MRPARLRRLAGRVVIAWEAFAGLLLAALLIWVVGLFFGWWG